MTWDYRILAHKGTNNILFRIHEVYYDERGRLSEYNYEPAIIEGESIDDILFDIDSFKRTVNKQILWAGSKFPEPFDYDEWIKNDKQ